MQTQRIRLSSADAEEVIEVRSTADGDHYCHVRDIQHALEFDTLATYTVDGVNIEYLLDSNGNPGTTRLGHFPDKVIEVTPCEPEESGMLELSRRPFVASSYSVSTAPATQQAVIVKSVEVAESPAKLNQEQQLIAVKNYAPREEPQRLAQEREGIAGSSKRDDEKNKAMQAELQIIKSKVKDIWLQDYELRECPIPRLFVILPEHKDLENDSEGSKILPQDKFRLHFICEGGFPCQTNKGGTRLGSDGPEDHVHLALHEGYELLRLDEFHSKFGRYALGMLRFMKECKAMDDTLVGFGSHPLSEEDSRLLQKAKAATGMLKHRPFMDMVINYLESNLDNKNILDVDTNAHNVSNRFDALSGGELRHLETFLHTKDRDVFGNLQRVITPEGRNKWVCMHHANEAFQPDAKQNFLQLIKDKNSGYYQQNLRHLTLSLKDPKLATMIIKDLPKFPFISELSLELKWKFNTDHLAWMVKRLNESSVVHLNLDLQDDDEAIFKPPKIRLLSMRKYQPLQQLYQNQRLQTLRIVGASRFGIRTLPLPVTTQSNLRTLHFRIPFDCKEDQQVLQSIIQSCPRLVDLQLGGVYKSEIRDTLAEAIGGLTRLKILHLYGMEKSQTGGVIYNLLKRLRNSGCPLRELVLVNSRMDAMETMELIKSCEKTLEVLVLDLAVFQPLKLTSILPNLSDSALDGYQLLRNLTSLHLHVADELQSVRRLSKTLEKLSLIHLGLSQRNPQGVKNSLEGKSLLHYVNFGCLRSLFLSGFSGSCLDPLWDSVKDSGTSATAHRPLESLSLEFLSDCPDLAKKLNRLALKSLWVIAEVEELGCEVNQLARTLNLSTLSNVALFKFRRTRHWYGSTLTERPLSTLGVGKYYEGLEKHIDFVTDQDLTLRVGEMIAVNDKLDLSILSVLTYKVQHADEQIRITPKANFVWRQHNPRYYRYRWGWSTIA
ncbi:hypothetical protein BGZ68_005831 [Mortierella alpina]|nr:hypothetical protein BGZ68_005831 [Mortierella alpina]